MNGTPQCLAANSPMGSSLQLDDRTIFAPVRSSSFLRRASSFLSTTYGNLRGRLIAVQNAIYIQKYYFHEFCAAGVLAPRCGANHSYKRHSMLLS
jgi:hypothetical protein